MKRAQRYPSILRCALTAGALLLSREAAAGYVNQNVHASPVFDQFVYLTAGTHTLETRNLSLGADPVLRLYGALWLIPVEFGHDDDSGGALNARLTVNVPNSGNYRLIVHAQGHESRGYGDVYVDGAPLQTGAFFGGSTVSVPSEAKRYETALAPNGATNTVIYGMDCSASPGTLILLDDNNGVGLASRLNNLQLCQIVVASAPGTPEGPTHLYANDFFRDADTDGLGNSLEGELGTCGASSCAGVFNPADSDRDGLSDTAEVFGIDDPSNPQYLSRWGADPRHKDAFIEVDFSADFSTNPFDGNDAQYAQSFFNPGTASDLRNPDGMDGIRLHLDIGTNPSNPALATLYGNWGGSSQVPASVSYQTASGTYRNSIRAGVFRYALAGLGTGGGQAHGDRFGWGATVNNRYIAAFVHELGHTFGLAHHGHNAWGAVNCKPNYPSLMNYAFAYSGRGFSLGRNAGVLSPSAAQESDWGDWSLSVLGSPPYYLPLYLNDSPFQLHLDWNRDGTYASSSNAVRAPVTWAPGASCGALLGKSKNLAETGIYGASPDLVRLGSRLYLFYIKTDNNLYYRSGAISSPYVQGSCPITDDLASNADCMDWGAEQRVPNGTTARSVTALAWGGGVALVYGDNSGGIHNLNATGTDAAGNLTGWSANTYIDTGTEPELIALPVNPAFFGGATQVIATFYNFNGYYYWSYTSGLNQLWHWYDFMRTPDGNAISASFGASLAPWPAAGGTYPPQGACAAVADNTQRLGFYCYDRTNNNWTNLNNSLFERPIVTTKPGLAYHTLRSSTGAPLGDATRGHFWLAYIDAGGAYNNASYAWHSTVLDSTRPPSATTLSFPSNLRSYFSDVWATTVPGAGISLYEDLQLGAMKGAWVRNNLTIAGSSYLNFMPFADGTFRASLRDGNDFHVMERVLCVVLRGDAYCGGPSTSPWGY